MVVGLVVVVGMVTVVVGLIVVVKDGGCGRLSCAR